LNYMQKIKLVHEIRAVKNKKELANIVKAQRISERVLMDAVKYLKDGVTELAVANYIKKQFIQYGAPILSFPPIVAFGKSAADIHHEPNGTKLKKGNIVMFDIGTTVNHYCSDMTRTYFWGKPTEKQRRVYGDVLRAQELAMNKIAHSERRGGMIDKTAREFLAKKYKNNFKHGLGHGVGTVIHEWPNFKPKSEDIIPTGCVMTVEPGIYLNGWGGIRIEDMILITKKGYQLLTKLPSDLESAILK
jgi:Xaa-Pro aminopeptidase